MKINKFFAIFTALMIVVSIPMDAGIFKKKKKKESSPAKTETAYQKLFKDKKYTTAEGFMTLHFTDEGKVIMEVPKTMLKKDMALTSTIENTSDGDWGISGYVNNKTMHIFFDATDSLVLIREFPSNRYIETSKTSSKAFQESNIGPIIAAFPIKAFSPDSTKYVFDATDFFTEENPKMSPFDSRGAASMNGAISLKLSQKSSCSMLSGIEAFQNNISVKRLNTYEKSESFMGLSVVAEGNNLMTIEDKWTFMLLPEQKMSPRIADSRLGLTTVKFTKYNQGDKGTKAIYYARKWNLEKKPLVFYIDPMFPEELAKAIKTGAEKWNEAFELIGQKDIVKVLPYPKDSTFNSDDLRFSCIKYEPTKSETIHHNTWTDPRTGEILSARIYVPLDALYAIHSNIFYSLSRADKDVRTVKNTLPEDYEGLQAIITRQVGYCLGLDNNFAGTYAVPTDSLRSPSFTQKYGLSGSIMDEVPYNYMAIEGDKERGVKLIHTQIGEYDKYAIKWLYSIIKDAKTPEDEVATLNKIVEDSYSNPLCLYVRKQSFFPVDPRTASTDLGNDPIRCIDAMKESAAFTIANMMDWIGGEDPDYQFRIKQGTPLVYQTVFGLSDMFQYLGGIYLNEKEAGDPLPSYQIIPAKTQREVFNKLLEITNDMDWLDNHKAYHDILYIKSRGGYFKNFMIDNILAYIPKFNLAGEFTDEFYSSEDAYNDILAFIKKQAKSGNKAALNTIYLQYGLVGYTLSSSNVMGVSKKSSKLQEERKLELSLLNDPNMGKIMYSLNERKGFMPIRNLAFPSATNYDHVFYAKLLQLKSFYQSEVYKTSDSELRNHYNYIIMAINRALKID